jgi:DUF4097 and DUF4098 domain-containing protein YvlB
MTSLETTDYPRTFAVAGPLALSVRLGSGNVAVTATDTTEASVDLSPFRPGDADALRVIEASKVELRGNSLTVHVPERSGFGRFGRTPAVQVRVTVPTGSTVTAEAGSADVGVTGTIDALDVQTGSGDVTAESCGDARVRSGSGDVRVAAVKAATVKSGSGDITVDHSAGDLQLQSGSGDIRVGEAGGDGRVATASGDVVLDRTGGSIAVKTASGSVQVRRAAEGALAVTTASGDLGIGIPEGTVARLECSSVSGHVHSQLEPGDAPSGVERRLIVNARTVSGDISIKRVG